jgi:PAS domain S-box-containing protein
MVKKTPQELQERIDYLESKLIHKEQDEKYINKLKQLLKTSLDTFYSRNLKTNRYDYISDSMIDILGYSSIEFSKLPVEEVFKIIHPEDKIRVQNFFNDFLNHPIDEDAKFNLEYRIKHKNGEYRWVSENISMLRDLNGIPSNLIGNLRDITKKKKVELTLQESEEKFRKFTQSSPVGIYTTDKNGDCTYANERWLEMTGLKIEEALGQGWGSALHPEDKITISENWYKAVQSKGKWGYEYRFLNKEGKITWIYGMAVEFNNIDGNPIGYLGTNIDITEIKNTQIQLKNSETKLKEINATKDKFFSIIAHDLKTPFESIIGFSELLVKEISNNRFNKIISFSKIIIQEARNTLDLLTNLLEWSRSQTGKIKFKPELFNLTELIINVIDLVEMSAKQKSIHIDFAINTKVMILADKNMMYTIFRNLISNSIKFTPENGAISVKLAQTKKSVQASVQDTGIGISESNLQNLFRISDTYTSLGTNNEKGSGLGLILCKDFINKHKGKIQVESQLGKGSKFIVEIPQI